jgi:lipoic acid synthetase
METRKPEWLKIKVPGGEACRSVKSVLQKQHLHTVCDSAHCPNKEECWSKRTATFMVLGDICTRNCRFCAVKGGTPAPPDPREPRHLAEAVKALGIEYAVVTCVTRDDLPDGGAAHWAACIRELRKRVPACRIEVLISDLQGDTDALEDILDAGPDVLAHNLETVERLYPLARPQADYRTSLRMLQYAADRGLIAKSGVMAGLGERADEMETLMRDAADNGVRIFTIGQYLQPSRLHLPVSEYVRPESFREYARRGRKAGIARVISGPLVRSSYHAKEAFEALNPTKELS